MLFEVVTIDLHYKTDTQERFDLNISKLKILWKQRHLLYILDALEVNKNIPKIYFKVNYPFKNVFFATIIWLHFTIRFHFFLSLFKYKVLTAQADWFLLYQ